MKLDFSSIDCYQANRPRSNFLENSFENYVSVKGKSYGNNFVGIIQNGACQQRLPIVRNLIIKFFHKITHSHG